MPLKNNQLYTEVKMHKDILKSKIGKVEKVKMTKS
jgi:hypothetical protein